MTVLTFDNDFLTMIAHVVFVFLLGVAGVFAADFVMTTMDTERCMTMQRAINNGHPITLPGYCAGLLD